MYKVIGSDGKIYGPIPVETLRHWIAEGRVNITTLVQPEGAEDWRPLSSLPQFAAPPAVSMPPLPAPAARQSNELAILGLVSAMLGCLCCCCGTPFALLGLILSLIALMDAQGRDRGVAIAGLVLSIFVLGSHLLLAVFKLGTLPWALHFHRWNFNGL